MFTGPAWHGSSLMDNLNGVSAEVAAAKPLVVREGGAHSIWEIVNHLSAWQQAVIQVMDGSSYVTLTGDADWPEVTGEWETAIADLESSHKQLCEQLIAVPDDKLREHVPGVDYSWEVLLRGIAEHTLYHAGQIGLLKKAAQ